MSRLLSELYPAAHIRVKMLIDACADSGIDLLVTSTYRSPQEQDELYAQGRTRKGSIVTNAKGGESFHNWRVAVDVVPMLNGKPSWDTDSLAGRRMWAKVGAIGEAAGLEWSGRWTGSLRELAHFQYTGKLTLAELSAGQIPRG